MKIAIVGAGGVGSYLGGLLARDGHEVAFLKARYPPTPAIKKAKRTKLANEPFIGMWRTRKDLQDSTAWVRSLRQREWERDA